MNWLTRKSFSFCNWITRFMANNRQHMVKKAIFRGQKLMNSFKKSFSFHKNHE